MDNPSTGTKTLDEPKLWWRPPGHQQIYTLIPDDAGTTTFHFVPFGQSQEAAELTWKGHAVQTELPPAGSLPVVPTSSVVETKADDHIEAVRRALQAIENGDMDKVVLSRTQVSKTSASPEKAFGQLCQLHPHALVYLMHHPIEGTWCGATPELLLRAQQHDVDTVSLAGTRKRGSATDWTPKEQKEQHIVTQHILDVLSQMGADDVSLEGPKDKSYGDLMHLETRISARYHGDLHTLAQALHPTPAVCGQPRSEADAFIRDTEQHDRSYYAGFLGWSSPLGCAYYVNLRCGHWAKNGLVLYAGGGIVSGSDPQHEWLETEAKLASISPAFQE